MQKDLLSTKKENDFLSFSRPEIGNEEIKPTQKNLEEKLQQQIWDL